MSESSPPSSVLWHVAPINNYFYSHGALRRAGAWEGGAYEILVWGHVTSTYAFAALIDFGDRRVAAPAGIGDCTSSGCLGQSIKGFCFTLLDVKIFLRCKGSLRLEVQM